MSNTTKRLAIAMFLATGCGGSSSSPTCGPGSATDDGLVLNAGGSAVMYESLVAGANGDCPAADAPAGVTSLTITGTQADAGEVITLCIPRPDLLTTGAHALGLDGSTADVRIIDLDASIGGCTLAIDTGAAPTGTLTAAGVCSNGTDSRGFALTFMGSVQMQRMCGSAAGAGPRLPASPDGDVVPSTTDTVTASLTGSVAVTAALP